MSKLVRIITEVTEECRVELKIMALRKRMTLPQLVKDILERTVQKKSVKDVENVSGE